MTSAISRPELGPIRLFEERFGPIRYLLAPMSGITDAVFRLVMREMGSQAVVSDLISAEGLVRGSEKTFSMMAFEEAERPIGIQLFGPNADSLVEATKIVESEGADFVDLNLGCPVKKVVKKGGGAAWLRDPMALGELLTRMKSAIRIPLTIKVRTGWDDQSINVKEVVDVAHKAGVSWVAIHGRTRAQAYTGKANWELIRDVAQQSPLPIIGNGDILTAAEAIEKTKKGYAHGVMIGRGALKNPWIFREILSGVVQNRDCLSLIERHFELAIAKKDPRRALFSLKKFMCWYASGLPYASRFKQRIFSTMDIDELRGVSQDYFGSVNPHARQDDGQPFLMGGHG